MQHIETIELTSSQSSITFSSIPQGYDDLHLIYSSRASNAVDYIALDLNGSSTNFSQISLQAAVGSVESLSRSDNLVTVVQNGSDTTSNTFSNVSFYFANYTSSAHKSISVDGAAEDNSSFSRLTIRAILWSNTSAITSITVNGVAGGSLAANSVFSLYGITAGGSGTVTTS